MQAKEFLKQFIQFSESAISLVRELSLLAEVIIQKLNFKLRNEKNLLFICWFEVCSFPYSFFPLPICWLILENLLVFLLNSFDQLIGILQRYLSVKVD